MRCLEKLGQVHDEIELAQALGEVLRDVNEHPEEFEDVLRKEAIGASFLDLLEFIPEYVGCRKTNPNASAMQEFQNCLWAGDEDCYILGSIEPASSGFLVYVQVMSGAEKRGLLVPSSGLPMAVLAEERP